MKKCLIQQVAILLSACCIILWGCQDKSKIKEEIKSIQSQIIKIDKAISNLIQQKTGGNSPIINVYPENSYSSLPNPYYNTQKLLNDMNARVNSELDAQINELRSRREILMIRLKILMEKL